MKRVFDIWISPGFRLPTLYLIVKSWIVCIPGGQERGSIPKVDADAVKRWCVPSKEFSFKQKQSVYNAPSSEPGASQPLVKIGEALWLWLL